MVFRLFLSPIAATAGQGGIKAQSKRGAFGQSWWAKRWISVPESFNVGARLGRGRSYARNGQVLNIDIAKGEVTAKVQGSRPQPYKISIEIKPLSAAQWKKALETLAGQALYTAKLLAGEMPQDIEEVFQQAKVSLFPEKLRDLVTDCSCPDWSNPCKHIAAVYYLIGEEFDRNPFLLFRLRGMDRDELLRQLGSQEVSAKPISKAATAPPRGQARNAEPLPADPALFWNPPALPTDIHGSVSVPRASAALPRRLGHFPFWRGSEHFLHTLEGVYRNAAGRGLEVFIGEAEMPAAEQRG